MEISQKRGAHSTRYVFHDACVDYAWKDSTGSRSLSVPYAEISRDRQPPTERQAWFRNAGFLWMLVGAALIAAGGTAGLERGAFWFVIGAVCYAVFHFNVTRYVILPTDKGNLLVLDSGSGKRIVNEIGQRRAATLRAEHAFSPEKLRTRFDWLHREGALSDEERDQRLAMVARMGLGMLGEEGALVARMLI